ncbi:MAG: BglG family transcription antiterminator [Thermosediminibacteraceae bacterium]|nr:BglG family transcription antiterminator [Thermosediminibacteraceae bacterium]
MSRLNKILSILLQADEPVTVDHIAVKLGVSNKTVRNDLKNLGEILCKDGVKLVKKSGVGVFIECDETQRQKLKARLLPEVSTIDYSPEFREKYILKRLFTSEGDVSIKSLACELFVSRATIYKDLEKVEEWLKAHSLKLIRKPNCGIRIEGPEYQWRNAVASLIAETKSSDELKQMLLSSDSSIIDYKTLSQLKSLADIDYLKLKRIVEKWESDFGLRFAEEASLCLLIHIAIAIKRLEQNKYVELSKEILDSLKGKEEYKIATRLTEEIETNFNIKFPPSEIGYITLHILGAKILRSNVELDDLNLGEDSNDLAANMAREIIEIAESILGVDLKRDKQLFNGLRLHLGPAINRLKYGFTLRNPILGQIKEQYPEVLGVAWIASIVFEKYLGVKAKEEEIGYIALHIGAALERAKKPLKALVVCTSGIGTSQLLVARLERNFCIEIVDVVSTHDLKSYPLQQVDIIISTVPVEVSKPYICISPLLTENDMERLNSFISEIQKGQKFREINAVTKQPAEKGGNFVPLEILGVGIFLPSREEVLRYAYRKLVERRIVKEGYLENMLKREHISPTAVGAGVAIPHGSPELVSKTAVGVITLSKPVIWGQDRVDVVFVLNISKGEISKARLILEKLFEVIDNKEKVDFIRKAKFAEEITKIMEEKINAAK